MTDRSKMSSSSSSSSSLSSSAPPPQQQQQQQQQPQQPQQQREEDFEDIECAFSTHLLHNKNMYELLDELQRNELKLLEQMDAFLTKKVALDQEYAEKVVKLHQKFPDTTQCVLDETSGVNKVSGNPHIKFSRFSPLFGLFCAEPNSVMF